MLHLTVLAVSTTYHFKIRQRRDNPMLKAEDNEMPNSAFFFVVVASYHIKPRHRGEYPNSIIISQANASIDINCRRRELSH